MSVNAILDGYIKVREEESKPVAKIKSALGPIRLHFGALAPEEITPGYQREYRASRRKQVKRRGARGGGTIEGKGAVSERAVAVEMAYLRAALKFAEHEKWIPEAPFIKLPAGAGINARKRALTREEVRRLMTATLHPDTAPHIRTFVMIALATAQRGIAVRDLLWSQVDFERNTIWFSQTGGTNNKRRADVPMVPPLAAHLHEIKKLARTRFVIEYRDKKVLNVKTGFANVVKRAGLDDVHIHDLRRTAATLALEAGRSFSEVAAMLKQNVEVTQEHYAHASPAYLMAVSKAIWGDEPELVTPVAVIPAPSEEVS